MESFNHCYNNRHLKWKSQLKKIPKALFLSHMNHIPDRLAWAQSLFYEVFQIYIRNQCSYTQILAPQTSLVA